MPRAVDVKGRRAVHAAFEPSREVGAHLRPETMLLQRLGEVRRGQIQRLRQREIERRSKLVLILVKTVMHLPELCVRAGKLGHLRRALRLRVKLGQRKIAKDEFQFLAEMLLHRLDDGVGRAAGGTFIIAILNESDRCAGLALRMVSRRHRNLQCCHRPAPHFCSLSSAARMPSAPGLTSTGERKFQKITPSLSMT